MQHQQANSNIQNHPFEKQQGMEAIILAGGLGTRLRSAVPDMPKCMAPVNGIPFLSFVIAHLQKNGIEHFIFSLGYKSEMITRFLDTNYQHISKIYVVENEQCGTGGAIKKACKFVVAKNVIVVNGDTLFTIDIGKLISVHNKHNADCTIALKLLKNCSRYGTVTVNSQSLVKAFAEKNQHGQGYINGGIYALHVNSFLNEALPVKFSFEKDWLEKKFGIKKFYGVKNNKYFIDIGVQEDYERAKAELINVKI